MAKGPRVTNGYDKLPTRELEVPHTQSDGKYEVDTKKERKARAAYWKKYEHPLHKMLREAGEEIRAIDPKIREKLLEIQLSVSKLLN